MKYDGLDVPDFRPVPVKKHERHEVKDERLENALSLIAIVSAVAVMLMALINS